MPKKVAVATGKYQDLVVICIVMSVQQWKYFMLCCGSCCYYVNKSAGSGRHGEGQMWTTVLLAMGYNVP